MKEITDSTTKSYFINKQIVTSNNHLKDVNKNTFPLTTR